MQVQHVGLRLRRVDGDAREVAQQRVQPLRACKIAGHGGEARVELHGGGHHVGCAVHDVAALAVKPRARPFDKRAAAGQHGATEAADALVQRHVDGVKTIADGGQGLVKTRLRFPQARAIHVQVNIVLAAMPLDLV